MSCGGFSSSALRCERFPSWPSHCPKGIRTGVASNDLSRPGRQHGERPAVVLKCRTDSAVEDVVPSAVGVALLDMEVGFWRRVRCSGVGGFGRCGGGLELRARFRGPRVNVGGAGGCRVVGALCLVGWVPVAPRVHRGGLNDGFDWGGGVWGGAVGGLSVGNGGGD